MMTVVLIIVGLSPRMLKCRDDNFIGFDQWMEC